MKLFHLSLHGIATTAAVLLMFTASGCRTTRGFGQDLQHVGHKIEHEADRHD